MSRFPGVLVATKYEIHRLQQNIDKLQTYIETENPEPGSEPINIFDAMCEQMRILQKIARKYALALKPPPETPDDEGEEILFSTVISETTVDVLEQSDSTMRIRLTYKEHSSLACAKRTDKEEMELTCPHSLPIFMPYYINSFKFTQFNDIFRALAQVFEAYYRRCDSVKQVQDENKDMFVGAQVQTDFSCSRVEFRLHYKPADQRSEYIHVKIFYPLSAVKARKVEVDVTGNMEDLEEYMLEKCKVFKRHSFTKAFQIFSQL